jgi:hypothetical protein
MNPEGSIHDVFTIFARIVFLKTKVNFKKTTDRALLKYGQSGLKKVF